MPKNDVTDVFHKQVVLRSRIFYLTNRQWILVSMRVEVKTKKPNAALKMIFLNFRC